VKQRKRISKIKGSISPKGAGSPTTISTPKYSFSFYY